MKKRPFLALLLSMTLAAGLLAGCGGTESSSPAPVSETAESETAAAEPSAEAADDADPAPASDPADDATPAEPEEPAFIPEDRSADVPVEAGQAALVFEPNYEGAEAVEPMIVEAGTVVSKDDVPAVTREGYRFAGWFTDYDPAVKDGVAEGEWLFGEKYLYVYGEIPADEVTSMPVEESMTLYARWVKETPVSSAEDLASIADDLSGWYVLEEDIDLSDYGTWTPLGRWLPDYESANDNWWKEAFRGVLDGNGHTISGLTLSIDEGDAFGYTGLFGAINGAEIRDLTLSDYRIDIQSNRGVNAAPLAGFAQSWNTTVENVTTNGSIDAAIATDQDGVTFTSLTGLIGAGWAGNYINCDVSGDLTFDVTVKDGSEINIGGINGEGYALSDGCASHLDMKGSVRSRGEAAEGAGSHTDLYIGGIQGGATNVKNCVADGSIDVSMEKPGAGARLYVGGIVGQERYSNIEDCLATVDIRVSGADNVFYGGIVGAWNDSTYGSIGFFSGITTYEIARCLAANTVSLEEIKGTLTAGAIVSSVPAQLEIRFSDDMDPMMTIPGVQRVSQCTALDIGLDWNDLEAADGSAYAADGSIPEDAPKAVHLYTDRSEMEGTALEEVLGSGWTFADDALPMPQ